MTAGQERFETVKVIDRPNGGASAPAAVPADIPETLLPVLPFNPAMLPESFRGWVEDIAERVQCPIDYPAAAALVAAGSVLGCSVAIYPKARDDWHEHANLWAMLVGRPGMLKTPALKAVLQPVYRLASEAIEKGDADAEAFSRARLERKIRADASKSAILALAKKGNAFDVSPILDAEREAEAPAPRRFVVNDASYEALCERCRENPAGFLLYQDELAGLFRRAEDTAGLREFLLAAWSVQENFAVDRIGRGVRHVPSVCLSVLGSIQPGKLSPMVRGAVNGGVADDGLLQRFGVAVWPDKAGGEWANVDRWPDSDARERALATFQRLATISGDWDPVQRAQEFRFASGALDAFNDWRTNFERGLRAGDMPEALEAHRGKYRKLVPAVALICHVCDNPDSGAVNVGPESLAKAILWERY